MGAGQRTHQLHQIDEATGSHAAQRLEGIPAKGKDYAAA